MSRWNAEPGRGQAAVAAPELCPRSAVTAVRAIRPKRFRVSALLGACLAAVTLSGCVTVYVDTGLHDVQSSDYQRPQTPQPVQLLVSFLTKGTPNSRATDQVRKDVFDTVTASGLFSIVSPEPVESGALLSISIDNVPITSTSDAAAKGFVTGLTFGLAGSEVSDGYICTADYVQHPSAAKLTKIVHHAIHATVGAHSAPPDGVKASSPKEAVKTMVRQAVGNALKELGSDPAFGHQ